MIAIAVDSLQKDMRRVEHVAMNIANTLTTGYKRQIAVSRAFGDIVNDEAAALDGGAARRAVPAAPVQTFVDMRTGSLRKTGQSLDLAIDGPGFFEVLTAEGPAYTRQGNFHIDERGRLVTAQGDLVMGTGGEIVLAGVRPAVDPSGAIYDEAGITKAEIAQLKLVRFDDTSKMSSLGNGLFGQGDGAHDIKDSGAQVQQGYLENSNVSTQYEMVQLMQATRHFESVQKAIQGYDELLGTAIRKLGEV